MRRALAVAAFLALASPALAAKVEMPVEIPDGATWTIETRRVRSEQHAEGPREVESRSRYEATWRDTKGELGLLTLRTVDGGAFTEIQGFDLKGFDQPLVMEVDVALLPLRLRNWPELRKALTARLDAQPTKGGGFDAGVQDAVREVIRKAPDDQAQNLLVPALNFVGLGQGLALERGEPLEYEDALPNPLAGDPIKTRARFLLESHDPRTGRAVISWSQSLDRDSMRASIGAAMRAVMSKSGRTGLSPAERDRLIASIEMSRDDRCRYEIHTPTGLATKTDCTFVMVMQIPGEAGVRRTDRWTITQTLPQEAR